MRLAPWSWPQHEAQEGGFFGEHHAWPALHLQFFGGPARTDVWLQLFRDKREIYTFKPPPQTGGPAFRRSLDAFGNFVVEGNTAELLTNGDQIFLAMIAAIGEAKATVNLESSMRHNAEESMAFYDRDLAARMEAMFADDIKHCKQVTYQECSKRRLSQRLFELLSPGFEPLY